MNTPQFTLQALFFVVNTFALCFVVYFVCKMYKRMNDKLDHYLNYMRYVSDRNDTIYINQLLMLKDHLIKEERYEEAKKINEAIDNELKILKDNESE